MRKGFAPIFVVLIFALVAIGTYYFIKTSPTVPQSTVERQSSTPSPSPTPDKTAGWKTCTNSSYGFIIAYPTNFDVDPKTCDYSVMDYNRVKDISIANSIDDFRKNWLLTITAEKTSLDVNQWIKTKCPVASSRCTEPMPGPIAHSEQYDLLGVHYAETDTVVKMNNTVFAFSLNARNPSTPVNQHIREVYDQILSTFKFTN